MFGRPRLVGGGLNDGYVNNAVRVITGIKYGSLPVDPLDKILTEKGVVIPDPAATFTAGGVTIPLFPSERQHLRDLISRPATEKLPFYDALLFKIRQPAFKDLSTQEALITVGELYTIYQNAANDLFLNENTPMGEALRTRLHQRINATNALGRPAE